MKITWFGHSCFLLQDSSGAKLLTDPFDKTLGYTLPNESVDVVTISHNHFDHNNSQDLPGIPRIIDSMGSHVVGNIKIKGISSFHDREYGAKRGNNIIFVIEMNGFTICHLGDLGHILNEKTLKDIGTVDILMIPIGGNFTINAEEAAFVARAIKSPIIFPMHYKTNFTPISLEGAEDFIIKMNTVEKINDSTIEITSLPTSYNNVKLLTIKK
ncbi:MAG: MBL fold metallo-hydrolase [Clostridiales bacterium]|uniref:MBL fold metallo-hydrolase n=1 Tax=Clostridium sp. N3C TaxID=1776758 RepID=UPI00092E011E|nr:MBL fold metallo-hydrolase [Clostridium sp. N3C]NLZ48123.1 MBL fold metallo-hydrolase [Clostridiales bacterium]SCN23202.1 metal-dependent hydrolase [Clostridium sp. N3C]